MYLKVVTPRVEFEIAPGDVVQAGIVITNSEVGHGTLSVQPLVYRLVCSNGLIASDRALRKTHVGRTLQSEEEAITVFRDDTLAADDKAFFLKVRDVVEAAVSEATFRQVAQKMQKTLDIKLTGDPVKAVEVLANRYTLNETERAGVLRHLIVEGDLSAYGLVNAVTHYSQDVEDYDRATEFEALGGKLIELSSSEWEEAGGSGLIASTGGWALCSCPRVGPGGSRSAGASDPFGVFRPGRRFDRSGVAQEE